MGGKKLYMLQRSRLIIFPLIIQIVCIFASELSAQGVGYKKKPAGVVVTTTPVSQRRPLLSFSSNSISKKLEFRTDSVQKYTFLVHYYRDGSKVKSERMTSLLSKDLLLELIVDSLSLNVFRLSILSPGGSVSQRLPFYTPNEIKTVTCDDEFGTPDEVPLFLVYSGEIDFIDSMPNSVQSIPSHLLMNSLKKLQQDAIEFYIITFNIE